MRYCTSCGSLIADEAAFCAACGKAVGQPIETASHSGAATPPAPTAPGGLADNVAGMVAYITIIPAILLLVLEPYNKRPFVRFHSFQSIFFAVAWTALWIVVTVFRMIPFLGFLVLFALPIIFLAGLILWILLLVKASQGQMWKLPFIGDLAEKQANVIPTNQTKAA